MDNIRFDHIWYINDVLRCIVSQRAIEARYKNFMSDLVAYFFQLVGKSSESVAAKRDCVRDYRAWGKTLAKNSG